ncbi:MAG: hypothetical protein ACTHMJ_06775 [Thermomicrobiales bacterium]
MNVLINLGKLADAAYVAAVRQELAALWERLDATVDEVLRQVRERL